MIGIEESQQHKFRSDVGVGTVECQQSGAVVFILDNQLLSVTSCCITNQSNGMIFMCLYLACGCILLSVRPQKENTEMPSGTAENFFLFF